MFVPYCARIVYYCLHAYLKTGRYVFKSVINLRINPTIKITISQVMNVVVKMGHST